MASSFETGAREAMAKVAGVKRLARIERALLHHSSPGLWDARRRAMEKIIRRKERLAPVYYLSNRGRLM